jgi:hypothetical protein
VCACACVCVCVCVCVRVWRMCVKGRKERHICALLLVHMRSPQPHPPCTQLEDTVVLLVSHDREFLDAVTTDTIHFKSKRLHYFDGNYSEYEEFKAQK